MPIYFDVSGRSQNLVVRVVCAIFAIFAFGVALMFSMVIFIGLALVVLVGGVRWWWKIRALRRTMRKQQDGFEPSSGSIQSTVSQNTNIIEGESVRMDEEREP